MATQWVKIIKAHALWMRSNNLRMILSTKNASLVQRKKWQSFFLIKNSSTQRKMMDKTVEEQKAQIERLEKIKDGKMKPELRTWLFQRLHILKSLVNTETKDEL